MQSPPKACSTTKLSTYSASVKPRCRCLTSTWRAVLPGTSRDRIHCTSKAAPPQAVSFSSRGSGSISIGSNKGLPAIYPVFCFNPHHKLFLHQPGDNVFLSRACSPLTETFTATHAQQPNYS